MSNSFFQIAPRCTAVYPSAHAGILVMRGASNPPNHPGLDARKRALHEQLREKYTGLDRRALEALPVIQAYNSYCKAFNKTYHVQLQLESIVLKGKDIPSLAALVEAMFMAEVKNQLLTAGHDLDALRLPVKMDVSQGNERYTLLRGVEQELKAGDLFMADQAGVISSIIYGPDQRTRIHAGSENVLFAVYAPPGIAESLVRSHLEDIRDAVLVVSPSAKVDMILVA